MPNAVATLLGMQLSRLNERISAGPAIRIVAVLVFCATFALCILPLALHGGLNAPPEPGDSTDYDAIGFQLSKGRGFTVDWNDPELRAPYLAHNEDGRYDSLLSLHSRGPTAYRPPLLPTLIAASHLLVGREFWPMRTINGLFLAMSCALAFSVLAVRFGVVPGVLSAAWLAGDPDLKTYSQVIMTEAPAVFFTTLMFSLMLRLISQRDRGAAIGLGFVAGLAFLTRTVFALWMPVIAVSVAILLFRNPGAGTRRQASILLLLFLGAYSLVSAPWMIRNSVVLGGIKPLGTMGSINLYAAYSDTALKRRGIWTNLDYLKSLDGQRAREPDSESQIEREKAMAQYSSAKARQWIIGNYEKIPLLMYYKAKSLWRTGPAVDQLFFAMAAIGLLRFWLRRPAEAAALLSVPAACTLSVALTWDIGYGRFLVPLHPLLAMLFALGVWTTVSDLPEFLGARVGPYFRKAPRAESIAAAAPDERADVGNDPGVL